MATLVFLTGFEHRITYASAALGVADDRIWDTISGTPSISASAARSGGYGLSLVAEANTQYVSLDLPAGCQRLVGSLYFKRVSGTSFRITSGSQGVGGVIFAIDSSGNVTAQIGNGTVVTGPSTSTGTWYRIDFDANSSGNPNTLDWKINGSAQTQATGATAAQDIGAWRFGNTSNATAGWYIDDVAFSYTGTDYPLGEVVVKGYWPESDGTHSPSDPSSYFRDAAGSSINGTTNPAWDNLTQLLAITTRVEQYARSDSTHLLQVNFADSSESTAPIAVQAVAGISTAGTQANNLTVRIRDGLVTSNVFSGDPSISTDMKATQFLCMSVRPAGGQWTDAGFDGLKGEIGLSSDISPVPRCYGLMLEAAFAGAAADNRAEVSWAEFEVPSLNNRAEVSWAEFEVPTPNNRAEVSWAEFEVPSLDNRAEISWAEFEVPSLDNRAEVSWAEFEVPDGANRAEVSWAELEVPDGANRAEVSWAEFEVPTPDNRAEVSWAEFEVPDGANRAEVSWAEFEVPDQPDNRAEVSWVEFEVPSLDNRAEVSWAEFEVPDGANRAEVSWAEFEVPDAPNRAEVSWAEFEVPDGANRAEVSWAEFEVPTPDNRAEVSWAEFEVPIGANRAEVSWAEFEVPDAPNRAEISWLEFEIPDTGVTDNRAEVSWVELEVPNIPDNRAEVSWTEFEVPFCENRGEVSYAEFEVPDGANRAEISWVEFEVPNVPDNRAEVSWAEFEVPIGANRAEVSFTEFEIPLANNRAEISWAEFEVPNVPDNRAEVSWCEFEVPTGIIDNRAEVSWCEFQVPNVYLGTWEPGDPQSCARHGHEYHPHHTHAWNVSTEESRKR